MLESELCDAKMRSDALESKLVQPNEMARLKEENGALEAEARGGK